MARRPLTGGLQLQLDHETLLAGELSCLVCLFGFGTSLLYEGHCGTISANDVAMTSFFFFLNSASTNSAKLWQQLYLTPRDEHRSFITGAIGELLLPRALHREGMGGNTLHAFLPSSMLNIFLRSDIVFCT